MYARRLVGFGIGLVLFAPALAEQPVSSFGLEQLRAIARSAHPTLESAEAAVEVGAGMLRQARAYPNPEVRVGFGRGRPRDGGASRSESTLEFSQQIEMPGLRRWRKRTAQLRARSVEFDRAMAAAVVDSTVSRLVYTALLEQRRAEIAGESAAVALRLNELLERRVELGESSPLAAVKARSEWFARRYDVIYAERGLAAARSALDLFCADRLPDEFVIAESLEGPGSLDLPAGLGQRLRTQNPLLLRAAIEIEGARAHTALARKESFPALELVAGHETELDRTATSVGVGLTIPLWNRNRGAVAAATATEARVAAATRALELEFSDSLEQASEAYRAALAAIRLHDEGWTATAGQALEIASFSFENGEASLLDVLDAQRSHLAVRSAEAESWAALALARTDIELLLAGPLMPEGTDELQ